jgi:hypothetical protein
MERKKRQPVHGEVMEKFYQVRTSPEDLAKLKQSVKEIKALLPYARIMGEGFPYSTTSDILLAALEHYQEYLRVYVKR